MIAPAHKQQNFNINQADYSKLDNIQTTLPHTSNSININSITSIVNNTDRYSNLQSGKYRTNKLIFGLLNNNETSPLRKQYLRALNCMNTIEVIEVDGGERTQTHTCCCKYCVNCSRTNSQKLFYKYENDLKDCKTFLTLTRQLIKIENGKKYHKLFNKFWANLNKRIARKPELTLKYIRTIEPLIKPDRLIHYHIHLLVSNDQTAEYIKSEWIKFNNKIGTERTGLNKYGEPFKAVDGEAQDLREFDGNSKEILKYFTKLDNNKNGEIATQQEYYQSFNDLLIEFNGLRRITAIGFKNQRTKEQVKEIMKQHAEQSEPKLENKLFTIGLWKYSIPEKDWINQYTLQSGRYNNRQLYHKQVLLE